MDKDQPVIVAAPEGLPKVISKLSSGEISKLIGPNSTKGKKVNGFFQVTSIKGNVYATISDGFTSVRAFIAQQVKSVKPFPEERDIVKLKLSSNGSQLYIDGMTVQHTKVPSVVGNPIDFEAFKNAGFANPEGSDTLSPELIKKIEDQILGISEPKAQKGAEGGKSAGIGNIDKELEDLDITATSTSKPIDLKTLLKDSSHTTSSSTKDRFGTGFVNLEDSSHAKGSSSTVNNKNLTSGPPKTLGQKLPGQHGLGNQVSAVDIDSQLEDVLLEDGPTLADIDQALKRAPAQMPLQTGGKKAAELFASLGKSKEPAAAAPAAPVSAPSPPPTGNAANKGPKNAPKVEPPPPEPEPEDLDPRANLMTIKDLRNKMNKFKLMVRVVAKSARKSNRTSKGDLHYFTAVIMDNTQESLLCFYGDECEKFIRDIVEDGVYVVKNGETMKGQGSKDGTKSMFDIKVTSATTIQQIEDNDEINGNCKFNLWNLKTLSEKANGFTFDLICIILEVGQKFEIQTKSGEYTERQSFRVADTTDYEGEVMVWGKPKGIEKLKKGVVVVFKGAKINIYKGKGLSAPEGKFQVRLPADMPEKVALLKWYDDYKKDIYRELTSIKDYGIIPTNFVTIKDMFRDVKNRTDIEEKTVIYNVLGYVRTFKGRGTYDKCPNEGCMKKVNYDKLTPDIIDCEKCGQLNTNVTIAKYVGTFEISDNTGSVMSGFNSDAAGTILHGELNPEELRELRNLSGEDITAYQNKQRFKKHIFRLQAKMALANPGQQGSKKVVKYELKSISALRGEALKKNTADYIGMIQDWMKAHNWEEKPFPVALPDMNIANMMAMNNFAAMQMMQMMPGMQMGPNMQMNPMDAMMGGSSSFPMMDANMMQAMQQQMQSFQASSSSAPNNHAQLLAGVESLFDVQEENGGGINPMMLNPNMLGLNLQMGMDPLQLMQMPPMPGFPGAMGVPNMMQPITDPLLLGMAPNQFGVPDMSQMLAGFTGVNPMTGQQLQPNLGQFSSPPTESILGAVGGSEEPQLEANLQTDIPNPEDLDDDSKQEAESVDIPEEQPPTGDQLDDLDL